MSQSNRDNVDQVKSAIDIVEVIGSYVELKPPGGGRVKGLCPFHSEKTPSFTVTRDSQSYYCFGCEKGGDVFTFLQEMEGVSFREALKTLADKAGIKLPEYNRTDNKEEYMRERLYELNRIAARLYVSTLRDPMIGTGGRDYLATRNLKKETVTQFGLGYVPDQWNTLVDAGRTSGFDDNMLETSGLTKSSDKGRLYDHFRNRLMFPIRDVSGRVVAFGGRDLGDSPAKYINSPETAVYKKSRVLYGLFEGRDDIRRSKEAILVEGYFDLLRLTDAGITNVVATCGTALTPEQAKLIHRYAPKVLVTYDGDTAGIRAALRSVSILISAGITVRALVLPDGMDPDDFIQEYGAEAFREKAEQASDFVAFYVRMNTDRVETIEGKSEIARELFTIMQDIDDPLRLNAYLKLIAYELGLNEENCRKEFSQLQSASGGVVRKQENRAIATVKIDSHDRDFVAILLNRSDLVKTTQKRMKALGVEEGPIWEIVEALALHSDGDLLGRLESESARQLYISAANAEESWGDNADQLVQENLDQFELKRLLMNQEQLQQEIRQAERSHDDERLGELYIQKITLDKKLDERKRVRVK